MFNETSMFFLQKFKLYFKFCKVMKCYRNPSHRLHQNQKCKHCKTEKLLKRERVQKYCLFCFSSLLLKNYESLKRFISDICKHRFCVILKYFLWLVASITILSIVSDSFKVFHLVKVSRYLLLRCLFWQISQTVCITYEWQNFSNEEN